MESPANGIQVGKESSRQSLIDDRHGRSALLGVSVIEVAACQERYAQRLKIPRRDELNQASASSPVTPLDHSVPMLGFHAPP